VSQYTFDTALTQRLKYSSVHTDFAEAGRGAHNRDAALKALVHRLISLSDRYIVFFCSGHSRPPFRVCPRGSFYLSSSAARR
jgi:hypothetical protein